MPLDAGSHHPQDALDAASPGERVVADATVTHTVDEPLTITTPGVTVSGLALRLADGADENLVEIGADGVRLADFALDGNRANQSGERQSNGVLVTGASNVTVAGGRVENVSRHGIRIVDSSAVTSRAPANTIHVERGPASDVTVRDVRVDTPRRDGCSVEGPDLETVSIENVRTFDSSDRGSVEVKDGASAVRVAGCHAENCVYGVAIQDHGRYPTRDVRIAGNAARNCETLVDAQTSHPPDDVVVEGNVGRDLGGEGLGGPGGVHAHLISGLVVTDNVLDRVDGPGIAVHDCEDVVVTGNVVRETNGPGVDLAGSDRVTVGRNGIDGCDDPALACRGGDEGASEVLISHNRCSGGIVLDGEVDRYLVTGNLLDGSVEDGADGARRTTDDLD
jgi:hypothetical protein